MLDRTWLLAHLGVNLVRHVIACTPKIAAWLDRVLIFRENYDGLNPIRVARINNQLQPNLQNRMKK